MKNSFLILYLLIFSCSGTVEKGKIEFTASRYTYENIDGFTDKLPGKGIRITIDTISKFIEVPVPKEIPKYIIFPFEKEKGKTIFYRIDKITYLDQGFTLFDVSVEDESFRCGLTDAVFSIYYNDAVYLLDIQK